MRDELFRYFERDIGRPPAGAPERVLAGLRGAAPPGRSHPLQWLAGPAAAVLVVLIVGTLLLSRAGGRPQPAGPPPVPAPRSGAAVAYDPDRGVLVVFGGTAANGQPLDDTWTWDGHRWARQRPAGSPPPLSGGAAMAFDDDHGTVVLYAGSGATWTWDGRTWRQGAAGPASGGPIAMAYDAGTRAVLLYATLPDGSHQLWSWDGARWSQLHPPVMPAVAGAVMAWDGGQVLLAGTPFEPVGGQFVTETWAWDGRTWSQLAPAVRLPVGTYAAAYDQGRGTVVVFVLTSDTQSAETWSWDGATWRREHPAHQPPARPDPALVYDRGANRVVLYDGDLWTWDGADWTLVEEGTK